MRLFLLFVLGVVLSIGPALAQEHSVGAATDALQNVLSNLKDSVEKLSLDNDQLTSRDSAMRQQISALQMHLGKLQGQGDQLNKSAEQLKMDSPRRTNQIARLEKENTDLDNSIQQSQNGIKTVRQSLDAGYEEDQRLLLKLKVMGHVVMPSPAGPSPDVLAAARRQKEKLKLMKMIAESELRQESLHESIIELQENTPIQPAAGALAHQEMLKEQIKELETEIAAYPSNMPSANWGYANPWDDKQLGQLESELKVLEKNYEQLKGLMEEMTQKAQAARLTESERLEEDKLKGTIEDFSHQSVALKADLYDLRAQMVDLDKRKTRLEEMVQHLQ